MTTQPYLIKYGDSFQLGDHKLMNADCRDKGLVEKFLGGEKIAAIISDPPYSCQYVESKSGFKQKLAKPKVIAGDGFQTESEYAKFTQDWLEACKPYLIAKNSAYIFNSDVQIFGLRQGMLNAGFKFANLLVWVKNQAVVGRKDYLPMHELIAFGWYGTHNFFKSKDKSVLFYPKPARSQYHPTSKPVLLIRHLVLNSSQIGDSIYDPYLGGGTCLLACEQTGRKCLGIELDSEYILTAIQRWEQLTGKRAVKIQAGKEVSNHG
jgi:DNA modification methylase